MKVTFFSGVALVAIAADKANATQLSSNDSGVTLGQIQDSEQELKYSQQATTVETQADSQELVEVDSVSDSWSSAESFGESDSESEYSDNDDCGCTTLAQVESEAQVEARHRKPKVTKCKSKSNQNQCQQKIAAVKDSRNKKIRTIKQASAKDQAARRNAILKRRQKIAKRKAALLLKMKNEREAAQTIKEIAMIKRKDAEAKRLHQIRIVVEKRGLTTLTARRVHQHNIYNKAIKAQRHRENLTRHRNTHHNRHHQHVAHHRANHQRNVLHLRQRQEQGQKRKMQWLTRKLHSDTHRRNIEMKRKRELQQQRIRTKNERRRQLAMQKRQQQEQKRQREIQARRQAQERKNSAARKKQETERISKVRRNAALKLKIQKNQATLVRKREASRRRSVIRQKTARAKRAAIMKRKIGRAAARKKREIAKLQKAKLQALARQKANVANAQEAEKQKNAHKARKTAEEKAWHEMLHKKQTARHDAAKDKMAVKKLNEKTKRETRKGEVVEMTGLIPAVPALAPLPPLPPMPVPYQAPPAPQVAPGCTKGEQCAAASLIVQEQMKDFDKMAAAAQEADESNKQMQEQLWQHLLARKTKKEEIKVKKAIEVKEAQEAKEAGKPEVFDTVQKQEAVIKKESAPLRRVAVLTAQTNSEQLSGMTMADASTAFDNAIF